ncbi:MAG: peptidoglycan DD-metalloendopeptidase family protein, partial [Ilumatobacter sp.]|nr:peptidoglycan DD-metalloendopeptidase family protein [Ilumatobacter sp.]
MKLRHLVLTLAIAASGVVASGAPDEAVAASSTADPDHPFSDPVWLPLREPARISCATTNCPGPYHGYDALDLVGDRGDPIYAAGAGVFHIGGISPGCSTTAASRGTWVWIDHGPAGSTRYHHLDTITATEGQLVTPGTQIGTMGNSGDLVPCEVNYLHFEVRDSENDVIKRPISTLRACVGSSTVDLPQSLGYPTWDDVEAQAHYTPTSDNSCLPNSWSDTPDRPPSVSIDPGVGSMEIGIPSRPAGVDDVRVRLQLFHPSVGEYGTITEQPAATSQSTVEFDDLLENREYRAMVSFHNSAGWSAWSTPVADRTGFLPHTPSFRESDSSHTTVGYKWYRGTNSDADYTVAIRRASGTSWGAWSYTDVPSTDLHYRFRGLEPGTKYQVTVRARNEFGVSDWAAYHTISTLCSGPCPESARIITSMRPARFADSRNEPTIDGTHRNTGRRAGGSVWEIAVAARAGVPSSATAAVVNLTVLNGSSAGYATVYPCGSRPNASSVNYVPGSIEPNEVIAKLSPTGSICVFTLTAADVVVDVVGYITDSPYQPLTPTRFADSRDEPTFDGQARARGPIASGSMWEIQIAG